MRIRPLLGMMVISWALPGCGDDGGASTADDPSTTHLPTTDDTADPTAAPTTAPTTSTTDGTATVGMTDGTTDSTTDSTTGSTTDEPALACHALELPAALVEAGSWDDGLTIAGFAGHDGFTPGVHDLALDPDGGVLAVGYFRYIGAELVRSFARDDGDGWVPDPSLTVDPERPTFSAIAVADDGRIALATYSSLPADLSQRKGEVLLIDGGEVTTLGEFTGAVRTMTWYGDELWVAGVFALEGQAGSPHLAVYGDMGWHPPPGGPLEGDGAYELTVDGDVLLVGGNFAGVGGVAAQSVAAWDGQAWTGHDLPDATVFALARGPEGDLYAGGLFSVEGSFETGGIARWDGQSWQSLAGGLANSSFRGVVSDLALGTEGLHVAGCFSFAGGVPIDPTSIAAPGLALWADGAWEALSDPQGGVGSAWFSPLKCGDEGPAAIWEAEHQRLLVTDDGRLYLGGLFSGVDNVASQSIIAREDGAWVAQGEAGGGFSGFAQSLAVGGPECAVHVMGGITHAGAAPVHRHVLRRDNDEWTALGPPVPADHYCWQIAVDAAGAPVLGCDLPPEGDQPPAGGVLRLQGDAWQLVGAPFVAGGVATVGFDPGDRLWAAGGGGEGFVARAEGDALVVVGAANGRVSAHAFRPTAPGEPLQLVVGGYFSEFEGMPAAGVAHYDGESWQPLGAGIVGSVLAVAYAEDGAIYASTADDGTPDRPILARWNGDSWDDVATPEPGPVPAGYAFYSLLARSGYVIASGFAWPNSGERNLFVYDGQTFKSLGGGATAIYVESSALAADGLWFGGTIAEAGPPDARVSSVGIAHLR